MANETKGSRGIRTMARLVDGRRTRTPAGALLELSAMANEKQLLQRELERWGRRHLEIETRLNEINEKERRLMAMVTDPTARGAITLSTNPTSTPTHATPADRRIKVQEVSY